MRTTIDIDEDVLARARALFPPGTPKTVIVEEGLRRLHADGPKDVRHANPVLDRLIREGRAVAPARKTGREPWPSAPLVPLEQLLEDLAADREDR